MLTSSAFPGEDSHTYYFRCRAMDDAGNQEEYPGEADAQTTVVLGPGAEWESAFGGSMNESGYSVRQTSDGGYIVAGYTYTYGAGDRDMYLVKASPTGVLEWDEAYGGADLDHAASVVQADDGGYVMAGNTRSYGAGESDIYIVKVSSIGGVEWDLTYGGPSNDNAMNIAPTSDGGYIVTGNGYSSVTGNDVFLLGVTDEGAVEWYETYGGDAGDFGRAVEQASDGGYIVTGGTYSSGAGGRDIYLFKTDSSGEVEWEQTYGGVADDYGLSVQETTDGLVGGWWSGRGPSAAPPTTGLPRWTLRMTAARS